MISTKTLMFALILVPLATATVASADDKVINGAACTVRQPEADNVVYWASGLEAEETLSVYCPLVRDSTTALEVVEVGFTKVAPGPVFTDRGEVTCEIAAHGIDNLSNDWETETVNILVGGGTLSFAEVLGDLTEGTDRSYTVKCYLDAGDKLGGVYWDE